MVKAVHVHRIVTHSAIVPLDDYKDSQGNIPDENEILRIEEETDPAELFEMDMDSLKLVEVTLVYVDIPEPVSVQGDELSDDHNL